MWFLSNANVMTRYGQPTGHFDYVFSNQIKLGSWMVCVHRSVFAWVPVRLRGECWCDCNYRRNRTQDRKSWRDKNLKKKRGFLYMSFHLYEPRPASLGKGEILYRSTNVIAHQSRLMVLLQVTLGIRYLLSCWNSFLKGHKISTFQLFVTRSQKVWV